MYDVLEGNLCEGNSLKNWVNVLSLRINHGKLSLFGKSDVSLENKIVIEVKDMDKEKNDLLGDIECSDILGDIECSDILGDWDVVKLHLDNTGSDFWDDYNNWWQTGALIKMNENTVEGFEYYDKLCQRSNKYDKKEVILKWTHGKLDGSKIGYKLIYKASLNHNMCIYKNILNTLPFGNVCRIEEESEECLTQFTRKEYIEIKSNFMGEIREINDKLLLDKTLILKKDQELLKERLKLVSTSMRRECNKYINKYFVSIMKRTKLYMVEIDYTDDNCFIERKKFETDRIIKEYIGFDDWKHWDSDSLSKVMARDVIFLPYTLYEPELHKDVLNSFRQFKHKVPKDVKKYDKDAIQPILDHLLVVWASNKEDCYKYILDWLSLKFQKPGKKIGVALVLKSVAEGAGKNIVYDFLSEFVMGINYTRIFNDMDSFLNNFNSDAERSLLTVLDEIGNKGSAYKNADKLKSIITGLMQHIEKKGKDRVQKKD